MYIYILKCNYKTQWLISFQQMMSANSSMMEEPEVDVVMERTDLPHHACQRCEQTFTSENDLAHHLIQHLSQTEE